MKLIGTKEIAEMFALSREYVTDKLTKRADFPKPQLKVNRKVKRWDLAEIEAWRKRKLS